MILQDFIQYIQSVFAFDPETPLLFTQFQFWAFFSLVFMAFAVFQRRAWMRNAYLFAVSLLFYYKTSGAFVGLLVLVTCSDFLIAQQIYRCRTQWAKRCWLTLSVCIDLGILCYFKYSYFFADIINQMFGTQLQVTNVAGKWLNELTASSYFSVDKIILPVGISYG